MTAQVPTGTVVALRVRTPELVASGPARESLLEIANAAIPGETFELVSPPEVKDTFVLPAAFELTAFDKAVIDDLSDAMFAAGSEGDALVVDLMMDQAVVRFGAIEQIFYSAVENFSDIWTPDRPLIVLVARVPDPEDDIAQILRLDNLRDAALFVDPAGRRLGHIGDTEYVERLSEAVTPTRADVVASAYATSLRRRGVFKVRTSPRSEYAAYKYSVEDIELAAVLEGYIRDGGFDVIILDSVAAHWLKEAGAGAAVGQTVALFHSSDLATPGNDPADRALYQTLVEGVQDPHNKVCLVVPMIKNSERVSGLLEELSALGRDDVQVLAVFLSDLPEHAAVSNAVEGWVKSVSLPQLDAPVHYLFDVSLRRLSATDWRVRMATFFGEKVDDDEPDWKFSRAGLWQMLDEQHANAGYTSGDNGVLMRMELDRWDAGWLAASLIRKARRSLERNPDEMLLVMPDDPTAIHAIGEALKTQQGTTVLRVPRSVLNNPNDPLPEELSGQLRRFSKGSIVAVDESTATYATMVALTHVVFAGVQRHPDLAVVVLDLPEVDKRPDLETRFVSLYGWRPSTRRVAS